jgi:3-oxoacyl-[acyl-carrier-protein] synthase II
MSMVPKRRVVITGIGAVTPLGNNFEQTWNGIIEGVSLAGPVKSFDASKFACSMAYEITGFKLKTELLAEKEHSYLNKAGNFAVNAMAEALDQAKLADDKNIDPYRKAVCLGVGMGVNDLNWFNDVIIPQRYNQPDIVKLQANWPSSLSTVASRIFSAKGPCVTVHTACASSGQSVGEAYEMIAYGDADVVMTGGADSMVDSFYFAGFSLLGALSKRSSDPKTASRPFDADRDGFVLGEGACIMILEDYEHAKKRGVKILGEVAGYGVTESAYRITDLHPEGTGPKEAMEMAVADAGINPSQVGYINAHGTSTLLNDRIEALAVSKAFPNTNVSVSSTKSMTGHMISAAGAMELAVCVKALEQQVLPPSVNLFNKDPSITVQLNPNKPTPKVMEYALSNSVGFGGSNTALVVRKV